MNEKQVNNFQSEDCGPEVCDPTSDVGNSAGRKAAFVKPELICHGVVADLTSSFGGSVTPTYRPNPLHPNPYHNND
jgi:hypothetical protein